VALVERELVGGECSYWGDRIAMITAILPAETAS
jgi:hypothetical protein